MGVAVSVGIVVSVDVAVLVSVGVTVGVAVGGRPVAVTVIVGVRVSVAVGVTRLEGRSIRGATQTGLSGSALPFASTVRMNVIS